MSDNNPKLPGLTKRAADEIRRMVDTLLPEKLKRENYIPVVIWISESNEPDFVPGPQIGANKRDKVPSQYIINEFGIGLGVGLPDDLLAKYQDCTLDFMGRRFVFIDETLRSLIDTESPSPKD